MSLRNVSVGPTEYEMPAAVSAWRLNAPAAALRNAETS